GAALRERAAAVGALHLLGPGIDAAAAAETRRQQRRARGCMAVAVSPREPPVARRQPRVTQIHGEERVDDYFWLRDRHNPDVKTYLEAENAYADAIMRPTQALQDALYREMLARIKETDVEVPYRRDGFFYYSRTEQGKQYPIHCR